MLLHIEESQIDPDIALVQLSGKLALGRESLRVEAIIDDLTKTGRIRAILDMSGVNYIDSAGVGLVALGGGKLKEAGGKLVVVTGEGRVRDLLRITQIDQIVAVYPTVEEAASQFGATRPPASA